MGGFLLVFSYGIQNNAEDSLW